MWRVAGAPVTWHQRLLAGLLSLGCDACVSHESAAQLHGFDRTPADRVEFTVARPRRQVRLEETVHTTKYWPRTDRVTIGRFRATSATRTIIDLARARAPESRLQAAIESAVRTGASAPLVVERRLSELRGPGRWGCRLLDRVLLDAGGHTMLERRFLELMRASGLPRPLTQVVFRSDQRTVARVDFLYRELAIVIEVSGRRGHSSPSEQRPRRTTTQRVAGHGCSRLRVHLGRRHAACRIRDGVDARAPHRRRVRTCLGRRGTLV